MPDGRTPRRTVLLPDMTYPEEIRSLYRQRGYWRDGTLPGEIQRWATEHGGRPALLTPRERWDHARMVRQAGHFAAHLAASGVAPGDAVVLHQPNDVDFVVSLLAVLLADAVPVLALPAHRQREIAHVARLAEAVAYLGSEDTEIDLPSLTAECPGLRVALRASTSRRFADWPDGGAPLPKVSAEPGDVALLLLSGGTTGLPKLIARIHADYLYNIRASAALCGVTAEDRYLAALPMSHNFPLGCPGILGAFAQGAAVVLPASSAPEDVFEAIARHRATITAVVPSLAMMWSDAAEWERPDTASLRLMQVGGAKLDIASAERLAARFRCGLQQVFGMAEGLLNFTRLGDAMELVAGTQGRPLSPDDELRIVDEQGRPVSAGKPGELLVRGPTSIRGYYRAPDQNRQSFTAEGFYRSGDRVRLRLDGYLVVEGRLKDVINRHGEMIVADEIEACLRDHPSVRDAAVFADSGRDGEVIHAVVVSDDPDLSLLSIRTFCEQLRLAPHKWPGHLSLVTHLPLTPIGKVDKRRLAALLKRVMAQG